MKKIIGGFTALTLIIAMLTGCGGKMNDEAKNMGFVHVENGQVVNGAGEPVWLKGIAFGNKVKVINSECEAMPRIDFSLAESVTTLNADYLEAVMKQYLEFGEKNNVPMYMGEFGAAITACKDNRGGELWTSDMLDICKKYNVHFTYHTYHENTFGLYQNAAGGLPSEAALNSEPAEVFRSKLTDSDN